MVNINGLKDYLDQEVEGQFMVRGIEYKWYPKENQNLIEVTLTDATGEVKVGFLGEPGEPKDGLEAGRIIHARLVPKCLGDRIGGVLRSYQSILPKDLYDITPLFSKMACPIGMRPHLFRFVELINGLKIPPLKLFVHELLSSEALAVGFVQSRAGRRHHHAYPGGLLEHTVRVMELSKTFTSIVNDDDQICNDFAIVGALLHDFGKVGVLGSSGAYEGKVKHELATIVIVEKHLDVLIDEWAWGGQKLREILDWLALEKRKRKRLDFKVAELIHYADAMDVMAHRKQQDVSSKSNVFDLVTGQEMGNFMSQAA